MVEYDEPRSSAHDVLERACALAGLVTAFTMERDLPSVDASERAKYGADYSYLTRVYRSSLPTGLALSPNERKILETSLGSWSDADKVNVGWRTECAVVLGFAIGIVDAIPAYDDMSSYDSIWPLTKVDELRKQPMTLRDASALDAALTDAERWHWRANQTRSWFRDPSVDANIGSPKRTQAIRRALGEDTTLFGKPYEELTFKEWSLARSIAHERHHALVWLWDGGHWDDVVADT
jgi:hypothetical protein